MRRQVSFEKQCENCHSVMVVWTEQQRFCSHQCRNKAHHVRYGERRKLLTREWRKNNPELDKEYKRRAAANFRKKHPVIVRDRQLRIKYGIGHDEYEMMFIRQGGACAICRKPETVMRRGKVLRLHIDHNHETGRVRELLCSRCNSLIGMSGEDMGILIQAQAYLKRHDYNGLSHS